MVVSMTVETNLPKPDDSKPLAGPPTPNQVFVLRLWRAEAAEWRGRVQHVASGETRYFQAWPGLVAHLEGLLADGLSPDKAGAGGNEETSP
jgi:hypothetical protein